VSEICVGGGKGCWSCGDTYGFHDRDCPEQEKQNRPRRFRFSCEKHPNGSDSQWRYGCYFPLTDLVIGDMGGRGTGEPKDVEWLD
jgi:hypothetical protein